MKKFFYTLSALVMLMTVALNVQGKSDPLAKYKLDLSDPDVCTVYYYRGGNFQAIDSLKVGVKANGTDSLAAPYANLGLLTDGKYDDPTAYCSAPNQGFFVFDFGEKGIDFNQMRVWNNGYYQTGQQTTVFGGAYGDLVDGTCTIDVVAEKTNMKSVNVPIFRTNGSKQNGFADVVITDNWVTGNTADTQGDIGSYMVTVPAGSHYKYRYIVVYDWSNYFYLTEVEIWGTLLKNSAMSDKQMDLERAIAEANSYVAEFGKSDDAAVAQFSTDIANAQALLDGGETDETKLAAAMADLLAATQTFMGNITYKLGEEEFYCSITTPDGNYGIKLDGEKTTIGSYSGYALKTCDPSEAEPFSIAKASVVNGQQAYQLSTANGVVVLSGDTPMLVDASQITATNPAAFVFTKRYTDGEDALYDMKAGNYFYYVDEMGALKATEDFPAYEDFTEIINFTFMLTPSEYIKDPEEAAANFKGWEFNDAAVECTSVYGDILGQNAGKMIEGWRFNKWRSYTRWEQASVSGSTYGVVSINNPYWDRTDTLKMAPMTPAVDENSMLTSANNGIGLCREYGKYASQASPDPIDQIRDSSNLVIVNPIYCPYVAVKMAPTSENVNLSEFSMSFFIKKGGIEPQLNMSNLAGKKGDVYYWRLSDCGFTVGQVGYSAQYMGLNNGFTSTKDAVVFDWVRPFESVDAIPEETIPAADLAAIVSTLPENPVYVAPTKEMLKLNGLLKYVTVRSIEGADLTADYKDEIAKLNDGDFTTKMNIDGNYFVIKLPELIRNFAGLKVFYGDGGNEYSNNVLFYADTELNLAADTYGNYVPNGGGLWMHTGFDGTVKQDADAKSTMFINDKEKEIAYIAVKWDNDGNPMTMTELELYYYETEGFVDEMPDDEPELEDVNEWTLTTNWASTRKDGSVVLNPDGTMTALAGSDNNKRADMKNPVDKFPIADHRILYYIVKPTSEGVMQNYNDMKFGYNATLPAFSDKEVVNEQVVRKDTIGLPGGKLLVYFDLSTTNANTAYFAGDSGNKFDGATKDQWKAALNEGTYLTINTPNLVLIGTDATNFTFYAMGSAKSVDALIEKYVPKVLDPVDYWTLTTNWQSKRTGGSVVLNEDGTLTASAGTDNAKRADMKNAVDKFYIGDHKVIFYVAKPTADGVEQNYNDMKFGYNATLPAFDAREVVNEQVVRKASRVLDDGSTLVYFDLSTTNANTAYFAGDSGNKFDGATKDLWKAALNEATALTISTPDFVLIGTDATNFTIYAMGSALNVDYLLAAYPEKTDGIGNIGADAADKSIFDMMGRRLECIDAAGLYIVNGKKVIVK